jgi:hypothetical protein
MRHRMMQEERSKEHNKKDEEPMRANGAIADGCNKAGGGGGGGGGGEGEGGIPAPVREEGRGSWADMAAFNNQ